MPGTIKKVAPLRRHITDINSFADYGVFLTPGLVINGQVKVSGKVPKREEIVRWIEEAYV
ncbi:MAG: thioredoxin family protein [Clostridia bacterium]|nr:thioredoxin family protein [Clostridia bacterium]MDQ7791984.1 thioredoxin family protein [Clostridia bacterium]